MTWPNGMLVRREASQGGRIRSSRVCRLALVAFLSGPLAAAQPAHGRSLDDLRAFFRQNCVRCHGADGSGSDPDGRRLRGTDFTRIVTDLHRAGASDEETIRRMSWTLRKGIFFGFVMPAWQSQLNQEEAERMVREVLLKAQKGRPIRPEGRN